MKNKSKYLTGDLYKLQETKIEEARISLGIYDVYPLIASGIIVIDSLNYQLNGHNIVLYKCLYPNKGGCLSKIFIPSLIFNELFIKQV